MLQTLQNDDFFANYEKPLYSFNAPHFKPAFSRKTARSQNPSYNFGCSLYISHLTEKRVFNFMIKKSAEPRMLFI